MSVASIAVSILLVLAVGLCFVSAVGAMLMRDPLQRLHFLSPPAAVSAFLITAAALVGEWRDWQLFVKTLLVAVTLIIVSGVVSHATARAALHHMAKERRTEVPEQVPRVDTGGHPVDSVDISGFGRPREDVTPWT